MSMVMMHQRTKLHLETALVDQQKYRASKQGHSPQDVEYPEKENELRKDFFAALDKRFGK